VEEVKMDQTPRIVRRTYLIKAKFQLRYIGLILLFMFAVAWVTGYTVYYTGWMLMGEKLAGVYPQGRLISIMRTINITLVLRLLFLTPLVVMASVFLSHRIAGPLFRIERYVRAVAKGDLSAKLHLRKNDELKDVAGAINDMTDDLRNRVKKLKGVSNMAGLQYERIKRAIGKEPPDMDSARAEIEELAKVIKDLDDNLSEYRVASVED
jgi:methyl-accepting chemotaxis protein